MKLAKLLFLLCLLLALCTSGRAQCPTSNVIITTDAEAMVFEANFGSCTDLPGDLSLNGPITYTKAFQNIQKINGNLEMVGTKFDFLDDFSGLKTVGGQTTIKGTELKGELATVSLTLTTVGGPFQLDDNAQLAGTAALENLTSIDALTVTNHPNLTNLSGLGGATINGQVTIRDNASLSNCAVDGVCAAVTTNVQNNTTIFISNNTGNCVSKYHVEAQCLGFPDCPPDVYVKTDQEASDFDDAFPNCVNLVGHLSITQLVANALPLKDIKTVGGDVEVICNIPNLDFLGVTTIGGDLTVQQINNGPELTNGPLPLQTIGGRLSVAFCPQITNLASFGNLTSVNELALATLLQLNSLSGLQNLELDNALFLFNLDQLQSLSSMAGINISGKTFERLNIENNLILEDISYLDDLVEVTTGLILAGNSNLSECSITPVCTTIGKGTITIQINNNDSDCNTRDEVKNICFPDLAPLLALYNATGGPNWTDQTGWQTAAALDQNCDPCNGWYGVLCENGRVTTLDLNPGISGNNLSGTLPTAFFRLSKLQTLQLGFNNLTGNLSGDIGLLTELVDLSLSSNGFTGLIPGGIGLLTNLQKLRLNRNNFNGTIPVGITNLPELDLLWLHNNKLSGSVPTAISNLGNLRDLLINSNELDGALPKINSPALTRYIARDNNFSGSIPEDLYVTTQISTVSLSGNELSGPLPQLFGSNSPGELRLDDNQLSGCYPTSYSVFCGNTFATFTNNAGLPDGGDRAFFDDEFCGNNDACGALPVSWLSFTAEVFPKTVLLRWATAAEENNENFTVERSKNGRDWQSLASQPATNAPAGNNYHFTDLQPLNGTAYYRIRQTDFDGASSFSEVMQVNFNAAFPRAFPNPFAQQFTLTSFQPELIQVFNQQGSLLQEIKHPGGGAQVQSLGLKSGVYLLRYRNSGKTERIVAR